MENKQTRFGISGNMQTNKQTDFANQGDTISRQAAIDALTHKWDGMVTSVFDVINSLPSAQPDLDSAYTEGYTHAEAKYRKMWDEMQANIKEKAFGKRKGLIHTADIDAMPTIEPERPSGREVYQAGYAEGYKAGQEERKTGKWERHYSRPNVYADMCWHCSNCGYKTPDNWANKWKFCPNCGARMVQEGEDSAEV